MTKVLGRWRAFAIAALGFPALLLSAPSARADIIEIENPTGGCSINSTSCAGAVDLTTLLAAGISVPSGTLKFLVEDTQGSFTIDYTGTSGNVGSCQLNGGTPSFFSSCVGVNGGGFPGFSQRSRPQHWRRDRPLFASDHHVYGRPRRLHAYQSLLPYTRLRVMAGHRNGNCRPGTRHSQLSCDWSFRSSRPRSPQAELLAELAGTTPAFIKKSRTRHSSQVPISRVTRQVPHPTAASLVILKACGC
jgi:hypothetical protein